MPIRAFIAYDFALAPLGLTNVLKDAHDTQPAELSIHYAAAPGAGRSQGNIWEAMSTRQLGLSGKVSR